MVGSAAESNKTDEGFSDIKLASRRMRLIYISKLFLLCMKKTVETADQVLKKLNLVDIKSHSARIILPVQTLTKSLLKDPLNGEQAPKIPKMF